MYYNALLTKKQIIFGNHPGVLLLSIYHNIETGTTRYSFVFSSFTFPLSLLKPNSKASASDLIIDLPIQITSYFTLHCTHNLNLPTYLMLKHPPSIFSSDH